LAPHGIAWPSPADCNKALDAFTQYHLSHNAGLLDVLIGQTAVALEIPLYTFNQRRYRFMAELRTVQPYQKDT
jgi:predicted nucleic acid-binding protein